LTYQCWNHVIAIEFLNGPRVLMLRVYAPWMGAGRRAAVNSVKVHGCYRSGIPVLIDSTEVAPDVLPDVGALRAALASSLPDSRIAIVVRPGIAPLPEPVTLDGAVFTCREDALGWLTAPDDRPAV
jgi:hypothetical protein